MNKLLVASGVVCAFVLAVEAQNQKVPPPAAQSDSTEPRITLDVNRVNMLFTVSDKKGRFVTDLTERAILRLRKKRSHRRL